MPYSRTATISGKGARADQFQSSLRAIALDGAGHLYAAGDRELKVFGPGGALLRTWPTERPALSVAVQENGKVLVGEAGQVEIFDKEGKRLAAWQDDKLLGVVTALDVYQDEVFVADARSSQIHRFKSDGQYVLSIGSGVRRNGFAIPGGYFDFAIDSQGVLHAANSGKHRVEHYSREGELLGRFGQFGMEDPAHFPGCCNPINLAVAGSGKIVVTEKAVIKAGVDNCRPLEPGERIDAGERVEPRVKVYDRNGEFLSVIADEGFDPGCKYLDVAVGSQERVYVADSVRLQISVFSPAV